MQSRADVRPIQSVGANSLVRTAEEMGVPDKWLRIVPFHDIDYSNRTYCRIPDLLNMQRNELQVMRIDMAGVDEALGFGTTAGDDFAFTRPALVVHEAGRVRRGTWRGIAGNCRATSPEFRYRMVSLAPKDFSLSVKTSSLLAVQTEQHSGCACEFLASSTSNGTSTGKRCSDQVGPGRASR